jgi:NAD(P)-dependent dehydrogenase (short-subunit alcohol dehydrogenase family)
MTFRALGPHPTVLVTGATDGIGRETAMELARRGARVIVHGRDAAKAEAVTAALPRRGGEPLAPLVLDLGRLADVRRAGDELDRRGVRLDVLLHNAGIYARTRTTTTDGFESTFGVNHLGPFALTHAIVAAEAGSTLARIVNVSSMAHARGAIVMDDLEWARRPYDAYGAYAASKLANVLFTVEAAMRLRGRAISVNALHPGVVSTKLLTEGFGVRGGDGLAEGAATSVRLALDADVASVTGAYFDDGRERTPAPAARDASLARALYERSATLTGVTPWPRS